MARKNMTEDAADDDRGGKRHALHLRTTRELREQIGAAAEASGRSMAQEVEFRLERSFDVESLTKHMPTLVLCQALALAFEKVQNRVGSTWDQNDETAALCRRAAAGVFNLLMRPSDADLVPEGTIATDEYITGVLAADITRGREAGLRNTKGLLSTLIEPPQDEDDDKDV